MATLLKTLTKKFGTYYTLQVYVYYSSQSTVNNTTTVYFDAYVDIGSGWINSSASKKWSGSIGGNSVSGTFAFGNIPSGSSHKKLLSSGSKTITHGSDGKKSIDVSCTINVGLTLGGSYVSSVTASGTVDLPTIARASSISSAGDVTVNGSNKSTVGISAKSTSFSHKVKWSIGEYSHTETVAAGTTSVSYVIPVSWLSAIPDAKTGSLKITLDTYSGSTKIGSSATKTIKISVPDEAAYKPTFTAAASDAAGIYSKIGAYVKGKSKLKISLTSIAGKYSASIKEIAITMNGTTYKPAAGSSATATSGTLSTAGTNTVTIKVTDSRGYVTTKTLQIEVKTYSNPYFSVLSISRYRKDGENYIKDDEGGYARVQYTANVSSVGTNALQSVEISYTAAKVGATTETVTLADASGLLYVAADTELIYNFSILLSDKLATVKYTKQLSTATTIMDILKGGLGAAFGKVAELAGYLDIAWNVIFRKNVYMNNYSNEEKMLYFQNDASRQGQTYEDTSIYPHNCRLYGGNGTSKTGIGLFDEANNRHIWTYNDVDNTIQSGATLKYVDVAVAINSTNASEVTYSAKAFPFLGIVVFHARFMVNEITSGVTTEIGTIPSSYAPVECLAALSTWVNSSVGTTNCGSHITTDGSIRFHFRNDVDNANLASGKYVYVAGVWTY